MILLIMELPTLPLRGNVQLYCGRSVWCVRVIKVIKERLHALIAAERRSYGQHWMASR